MLIGYYASSMNSSRETSSPGTITIQACKCLACEHVWIPRKLGSVKKRCPRCQCADWDNPVLAGRLRENREAMRVQLNAESGRAA